MIFMSRETKILRPPFRLSELRELVVDYHRLPNAQFNMLVVVCGLPRSGKSTFARQLSSPMVEPDAVRLAFQGRPFIRETEEWIWSLVRLMVRSLFYAGHADVVTTGIYGSKIQRRQWLANEIWRPVFCCVETPVQECLNRAKATLRPELEPVVLDIAKTWTAPTSDEGPVVTVQF